MKKFYKIFSRSDSLNCIITLESIIAKDSVEHIYKLEYTHENFLYKQLTSKNTICSFKTLVGKDNKIVLSSTGDKSFSLDIIKDINLRGKGLLSYFIKLILNDTRKLLSLDLSKYVVYFPDNELTSLASFEKLGFNLEFEDIEKTSGFIKDTLFSDINFGTIQKPECLIEYLDFSVLMNDLIDTVPFSNTKSKKVNSNYLSFITSSLKKTNEKIDLSKVVGSSRPEFYNNTWKEILKLVDKNKIFVSDLSLDFNEHYCSVSYYINPEEKMYWEINVINGEYFICSGNHRTTIAKYLCYLKVIDYVYGVEVNYIEYDEKEMKRYLALMRWLKTYHEYLGINLNVINNEEKGERVYFIEIGIFRKYFKNLDDMYKFLKNEIAQNKIDLVIFYLKKKFKYMFNKIKILEESN